MYQFTASSCPPATDGPPPAPLVINPELLADPNLSWVAPSPASGVEG